MNKPNQCNAILLSYIQITDMSSGFQMNTFLYCLLLRYHMDPGDSSSCRILTNNGGPKFKIHNTLILMSSYVGTDMCKECVYVMSVSNTTVWFQNEVLYFLVLAVKID